MSFKTLLAAAVAAAAVAPASATASADSISCRVGYYAPGADTASPTVTSLRAHKLPRKTDGYAPRCLVAESIVAEIQDTYGSKGRLPAKVWVYGARWDGGRWRCSYPDGRAVCRKIGKPRRRVTMHLAVPG
jgi:hypothetical protein